MSNIYWQVHFKRENNSRITRKHSLTLWKEASPHYEVLCEILLAVCFSFSMGIPHSLSPVILSFVHCPWFIACLWINNRQILPYSHQVNMASTPPQPSFLSISTIAVLTSDTHLGLVRLLGKYCYVFRKSSVYELCLIVIWSPLAVLTLLWEQREGHRAGGVLGVPPIPFNQIVSIVV